MKAFATATGPNAAVALATFLIMPGASYQRAVDSRKRPIRGLWVRNGKFYARLSVVDPNTGRKEGRRVRLKQEVASRNGEKALEDVTSLAEAQKAVLRLKSQRNEDDLPSLRRTPKFSDYVDRYLDFHRKLKDGKRPDTLETEVSHLNAWKGLLGDSRLDQIDRTRINGFIAKRQGDGVSGRPVNLAVTVLRNVLNHAIDEHWLKRLPTENLRPLKWTPKKRQLFRADEIEQVCNAAFQPAFIEGRPVKDGEAGKPLKNAQQFADYTGESPTCSHQQLSATKADRVTKFSDPFRRLLLEQTASFARCIRHTFPAP